MTQKIEPHEMDWSNSKEGVLVETLVVPEC